jgi:hypothetical protein
MELELTTHLHLMTKSSMVKVYPYSSTCLQGVMLNYLSKRMNLPLTYFNSVTPTLRPPLWSSGQSSWLQIKRFGFDSRGYHSFWEVVGLKRGPLSLVSINEELLGRKSSGSGLEIREYNSRDPSRWPCITLYQQKLALTSPKSSCRSAAIARFAD